MLTLILTGNFPGYLAAGFEEDSLLTAVGLLVHAVLF